MKICVCVKPGYDMLLIVVSIAKTLPYESVHYWNDYMLVYEKMGEPAKTPVSAYFVADCPCRGNLQHDQQNCLDQWLPH